MIRQVQEFQRIADDPLGYGEQLKTNTARPVFGYFCSYTPEEIIHAAGFHPYRILGAGGSTMHSAMHLQARSCALIRGALEDALTGRLSFLHGVVFPHTCDSIQRLSDIWRLNSRIKHHFDIVLPVSLDTESAQEYMIAGLKKFRRDLETAASTIITDTAISHSFELYNSIRDSFRRIYELRSAYPALIRGEDMHALVRASMVMNRNDLASGLLSLLSELGSGTGQSAPTGKRVIVAGGICDHPDFYRLVEHNGGVVVWDDLCTGSRFFEGTIPEGPDPLAALAQRYITRPVCPARHTSATTRGENLLRMAREHNAQGVVFIVLKFCDSNAFDYTYMKELLDEARVPNILLEIDKDLPAGGEVRLETRLQAFMKQIN